MVVEALQRHGGPRWLQKQKKLLEKPFWMYETCWLPRIAQNRHCRHQSVMLLLLVSQLFEAHVLKMK
jgi:hypothetical protein